MKDNFEECLAHVLKHEGGYVDHPKDPGGATNHGCTKKVWEEWVGHEVTKDDMPTSRRSTKPGTGTSAAAMTSRMGWTLLFLILLLILVLAVPASFFRALVVWLLMALSALLHLPL